MISKLSNLKWVRLMMMDDPAMAQTGELQNICRLILRLISDYISHFLVHPGTNYVIILSRTGRDLEETTVLALSLVTPWASTSLRQSDSLLFRLFVDPGSIFWEWFH